MPGQRKPPEHAFAYCELPISRKKPSILRQNESGEVTPHSGRRHEKAADTGPAVVTFCNYQLGVASALAGFETALRLVDDVKAATTPNNLIVAVAFLQCFQ